MNILIVHNYYRQHGGEDTVVANEKSMLEKFGHKVVLYTRSNMEMDNMGIVSKMKLPFISIFSLKTYNDIKAILRKNYIDVVHVHNTLNLVSPSVYYAARVCKVPVVQTVHNFRFICPGAVLCHNSHICEKCVSGNLLPGIINRCYRNSLVQTLASSMILIVHRIMGIYGKINYIALTEFNKNKLLNLKQIKSERVFIKPNSTEDVNGVNVKFDSREGFVYAGRLEKLKGIHILLNAWERLGENAPKLTICGNGELEERCRQYVTNKHIHNVTFTGRLSHDELNEIISHSKALVFPSIWYEGLPMTIIETFALSVPVIVGDIGNGGALVEDGINGIKYDYDKSEALARVVLRMMKMSEAEYESLCINARKEYESRYTEELNYQELMRIYQTVLND